MYLSKKMRMMARAKIDIAKKTVSLYTIHIIYNCFIRFIDNVATICDGTGIQVRINCHCDRHNYDIRYVTSSCIQVTHIFIILWNYLYCNYFEWSIDWYCFVLCRWRHKNANPSAASAWTVRFFVSLLVFLKRDCCYCFLGWFL